MLKAFYIYLGHSREARVTVQAKHFKETHTKLPVNGSHNEKLVFTKRTYYIII